MINYLSTKEVSKLWNLSSRRVSVLASTGRIPGAKLVGKTWLIPEDAVKPIDARYKSTISADAVSSDKTPADEEIFFPLIGLIYNNPEAAKKNLTASQFELYKAQKLCLSGKFEEADILLTQILNSTNNNCMLIGSIYFKIYTDIILNNQESLINICSGIQQIDITQMENREELSLILLDINGILYGNKIYIENFKINKNYNYSSEALPYILLIETYTSLITTYTSGEKSRPELLESSCIFMKLNNYVYCEIAMHIYIGMMYRTNDDIENYLFHIQQALKLAEKNEMLWPFISGFKFMENEIINYLNENPFSILKNISELTQIFDVNSNKFLQKMNIIKIYFSLNPEDLELIEDARLGLTNKEIAKAKNISESYVSKKYFQLCKKTGVSTKKELVDMFIENMKI